MAVILVVDDSSMSRRVLRRILEPAGYSVVEADDGLAALEHYALERPDMVMLDMTMRGMHGLEVLAQLRALDPDARVVVASADIQRSTRELVEQGGARGFVAKPFEGDLILAAVESALAGGS